MNDFIKEYFSIKKICPAGEFEFSTLATSEERQKKIESLYRNLMNIAIEYNKTGETLWKKYDIDKKIMLDYYQKAIKELALEQNTTEYKDLKGQFTYFKRKIATDKTKGNLKYLTLMFEKSKDPLKLAESLFNIFYDTSERTKQYYANLSYYNGPAVYELFFRKKPILHSWRFEKDGLLFIAYRNQYGPAQKDYADFSVSINDFEVLDINHRADTHITEEIYTNKMKKAFGKTYEKELEAYKFKKRIETNKEMEEYYREF